jgi:site-specific recombinase XerD
MTDIIKQQPKEISQETQDRLKEYIANASAKTTTKAYKADWRHYQQWCEANDRVPCPAEPDTVAVYITELAETRKPSTIARRLTTIRKAHKIAKADDPTEYPAVQAVWEGIKRSKGTAPKKAKALLWKDIQLCLESIPDNPAGARDRALLLVGFCAALRRSEICALDVDDLERTEDGYILTIRRSKTDQEGRGRRVGIPQGLIGSDPVEALDRWLAYVPGGALFRAVKGQWIGGRLSGRAVSEIVKRITRRAKLPGRYSGHSLRRGLATSAARAGVQMDRIRATTGHKSMRILQEYIDDGKLFVDNAAAEVIRG